MILAPHTSLGKWSVGLILVFLLMFVLMQFLIWSGQQGGETFFDNLLLSIPALVGGVSAISAVVVGLTSIAKQRERGFLVFVSVGIGILISIFIVGEFAFPH